MIAPLLLLASVESSTVAEGPDPLRYAKYAAIVDGGWSIALTAAWALSARSWDAPYPDGLIAIGTARVLYGTTWSILLATDVAIARAVAGSDWAGMSRGAFKNHWLVGVDVPGRCRERSGCGLGLGSFGEISALVSGGDFPMRAALTGGWIQGRYLDDGAYTLVESTWVQAPVSVWVEPKLTLGPVALELSFGPGLYWGMHNAHVHPKPGSGIDVPIHELIPLHYGVGLGAHTRVSVIFFDVVALDAEVDLAVLFLGGSNEGAPALVHPLDPFRDRGTPLWRKCVVGLRFMFDGLHPLVVSLRGFAGELSPGAVDKLGHLAGGLQFEVPIELNDE